MQAYEDNANGNGDKVTGIKATTASQLLQAEALARQVGDNENNRRF